MNSNWYSFDVSTGWVVVAIISAAALAILLYSKKKTPWNKAANISMAFLRFVGVFLIILLLLNPILELFVNTEEPPKIILAIDDSESVISRTSAPTSTQIQERINSLNEELSTEYLVEQQFLSAENPDSLSFIGKTTDLNALLRRVTNIYEDQNTGAVVLISDGIMNQGQSPEYNLYPFPVYTVGLGDTVPPKDVAIKNIRNNKVAYQGNKFPVSITLSQKGYDQQPLNVVIREGNQILDQQEILTDGPQAQINFSIDAKEPGLRRLSVSVSRQEGESSYANNSRQLYIDVIEGKDKVLILAPAPHPDINAIRSVLSQTANYETTLYIPGIHQRPATKTFDVIIEHQAFSNPGNYGEFESAGKWYIMGNDFREKQLTASINYLTITRKGNNSDLIRGSYNTNFSKFKLDNELTSRFNEFPPLEVPFGEYQTAGPVETLLYQKVGSITTDRPLLTFFDDGTNKSAMSIGTGIWQWKLQELGSEENSQLFSALVLKTVQLLSIKVNKSRFIVKPRESSYQIGERVFIDTEVYNNIYERNYGNTIALSVTNESGQSTNYEMVDSPVNSSFNLGSLSPGIYQFTASTTLDSKRLEQSGSFVVKDVQLEQINLTANHHLLQKIAQNTEGKFYHFSEIAQVADNLKASGYKNLIHTTQQDFPLINSIWIIMLIILCLCAEWFLRKYLGAY